MMAEAVSVSNQGRQLVCSICQKIFEEMTISSCFHTFCLDCLRGQMSSIGGTNYRCPICKVSVNLPGEVIRHLRSDRNTINSSTLSQTCDICSDGKMAINRCMQCEESLCHACTNAHLKMKASRYHRQHVVPLTDQSETSDLERSRYQKNCWRHRNEEIQFVCKKCDVLLCLVCKLLEHEHHVTKPIAEEANEVRRRLGSLLQKQVSLGEKLQMKIRETEIRRTEYPLKLDQQLTKLNHQVSQMHTQIENEKLKAEKELKLHYGDHVSKHEADGGQFQQDYEAYHTANSEALQLIHSNHDDDVYVVGKGMLLYKRLNEIEGAIGNTNERSRVTTSKRFQTGVIDSQQIQNMMGFVNENGSQSLLRRHSSRHVQTPAERSESGRQSLIRQPSFPHVQTSANRDYRSPEIVLNRADRSAGSMSHGEYSSYNPLAGDIHPYSNFVVPFSDGLGYVYGIAPVDNSRAWITLLDHRSVLLVDSKGSVLSSADVGDQCEDVAANLDGNCYVTCPRTKCIKRASQDDSVETVYSDFPQDPHGIALVHFINTENNPVKNELYVCFTATRGSTVSLYDNQKGCLRKFSDEGEDLGRIFLSQAPVRLDVHPESSTLCVSDHSSGCVIISDLSGQFVKAIYTGESEEELFKPLGVCFDSRGNVIVAEWNRNRISLISQEGVYLKTLVESLDGPQTVAFRNGLLWVGSKHGAINVYSIV